MHSPIRFEDPLAASLKDGWRWIREAPDAWRLDADALHIRALPGTLWGERNDARNLLIRPGAPVVEGFANEVTVHNAPQLRGEQGGVIWYVDDGTYIKLIKESLDNSVWIVIAREVGDQPALVNRIPWGAPGARLKLALENGKVTGSVRDPEKNDWQVVGECDPLPQPEVHPGLFTHGGPEDEVRWAEFTGFAVTSVES